MGFLAGINMYVWMVPSCILFFIALSWLYVLNNQVHTPLVFLVYTIFRALPLLPIISRMSKNPLFDSMLYDVLMFLVCAIVIGFLSKKGFAVMSPKMIIGFVLVCIGFTLMQIKS
jgi:hypothetical protein